MPNKGWLTITLPEFILREVDKLVEADTLGYKSRSEFIKESIRQRIIDLKKTGISKE
ncbi:MAG: ribbon-helix-helix domain-containing protein [Conexivisphaerales archaeon]